MLTPEKKIEQQQLDAMYKIMTEFERERAPAPKPCFSCLTCDNLRAVVQFPVPERLRVADEQTVRFNLCHECYERSVNDPDKLRAAMIEALEERRAAFQ